MGFECHGSRDCTKPREAADAAANDLDHLARASLASHLLQPTVSRGDDGLTGADLLGRDCTRALARPLLRRESPLLEPTEAPATSVVAGSADAPDATRLLLADARWPAAASCCRGSLLPRLPATTMRAPHAAPSPPPPGDFSRSEARERDGGNGWPREAHGLWHVKANAQGVSNRGVTIV